ncbi:hypothetical protein BASA81_000572 [Batrachochytrium salamandrivorans]|nr:hypothetical protein BASA81_000572 [Batrachochytrium salamandrivorans]
MKGHAFFRPWIQVHNVKSVEELENPGMIHLTDEMLTDKVSRNDTSVHETRNFIAEFISELDLRDFPFDAQKLRITIVSNTTAQTTFSHKMGKRDPATKMSVKRPTTTLPIKCNLEADLISEWSVLLENGNRMHQGENTPGVSNVAAVNYVFGENDKFLSGIGAVYQRMDMYLMAVRELKHIMFSICFPSLMLAASSLCIFALEEAGDRFGVLFTIILTIVANQFTTQDRLPNLSYYTWMDSFLMSLQVFVYVLVVWTAILHRVAALAELPTEEIDLVAFYVMVGAFVANFLYFAFRAVYIRRRRQNNMAQFLKDSSRSFEREEARLHHMYYPDEEPQPDYVGVSPAPTAVNKVENLVPVADSKAQ